MSEVKTVYSDVEITYFEGTNDWHFELRGRSRTAPTLAKAKEAIDAPPPKDKKPFTRIKAYLSMYSGIEEVEITSLAESRYRDSEVWISSGGNRRKVERKYVMAFTDENKARYDEFQELRRKAAELDKQAKEKINEMTPVDFSGCE
jgi:hypothetical protein